MKMAMFLDVDGVLTETPANMQLAQLLGVASQLRTIEEDFAAQRTNNKQFNQAFVPLFRDAGFTSTSMAEFFDQVDMKFGHDDLLTGCPNVDVYLVSSGPNYFVDPLAERFGIPPDRVLCSQYQFDGGGRLSRCARGVDGAMKGAFVRNRLPAYDISLGVGDNPLHDVAFLSQCTIKVLVGDSCTREYINVRELAPLVDLVNQLTAGARRSDRVLASYHDAVGRFRCNAGHDRNVFIMTPFRDRADYRELIAAVKSELEAHGLRGWVASDQGYHDELWDNVQIHMLSCDFGVAIFTPDDDPRRYNSNVTIEVGYMLSRGKPVLLLVEKRMSQLFTDINGFLREPFDLSSSRDTVRAAVRKWLIRLGVVEKAASAGSF